MKEEVEFNLPLLQRWAEVFRHNFVKQLNSVIMTKESHFY